MGGPDKVTRVFFHHGLFCSTHPLPTIVTVICIFLFFCFPLRKVTLSRNVPFEAVPLPESKCKSVLTTPSLQKMSNYDFNFTFVAQIIFRSVVSPLNSDINYIDGMRCNLNASFKIHEIVKSTTFANNQNPDCRGGDCNDSFASICMRMKDLITPVDLDVIDPPPKRSPTSRILSLPTPSLPLDDCAIFSPSLIWNNELSLFHLDDIDLSDRLHLNEIQDLLDVLFGLPRRNIDMPKVRFRYTPGVNAFATTLVFRDFQPEYIHKLRERLMEAFPESRFVEKDSSGTSRRFSADLLGKDSAEPRVFVVHYRGHNYFVQYAPAIAVYTFLILYICFSVSKIDMVKSKFGLAVSACFTIFASFVMTLSLCVTLGLMSPALRGREFFPYLVVLIGFENILVITKAVVGTPVDLPVKHRVAQGLAKEGWSMTKNLLCAFVCTALGFLTFDSAIQEFCLIAMISFTTDFFLQLFFFVPVLAVDIRRMELSDLQRYAHMSSMSTTFGQATSIDIEFCNHISGGARPRDWAPIPEYHRRSMSPIPQNSQNFSGHRRVRSDASNAAFIGSDSGASNRNIFLRRRLLNYWTNRHVFQRVGMAIILIWLIGFLCYAFIPSPSASSSAHTSSSPLTSVESASFSARNDSKIESISSESEDASVHSQLFSLRSISRHGFEVRWDTDSLWRYFAFSTWPAIADRYNISLAGKRLVVFEPIHVVRAFSPAEAIRTRPPAYDSSESSSRQHSDELPCAMPPPGPAEDQECDGDRTWWSHVLAFGHKEALAALGLPWSGFLDWTNRLWSTATMAAASLLGAGFFLTITALVMLLVHKWLSRSNPNACREPVVRVRQLAIPLLKKDHSIEEWIVALGNRKQFCDGIISLWNDGLVHDLPGIGGTPFSIASHRSRHRSDTASNLIAATVSGYFGGPTLIRSIRLWSADCGHLVAAIDRFYPESCEIRGASSRHRDLSRRFSPVWSMKILAPTGSLVVGCANGTIEVWDLDNFRLRQVIDLTSPEAFYDAHGDAVETGGKPISVGGVTVIEPSLENQHVFYFGTSRGFVGYVKWGLTLSGGVSSSSGSTSTLFPTSSSPGDPLPNTNDGGSGTRRPMWSVHAKWSAHPRDCGVVHLTPQRVFPTSPSRRFFTRSTPSYNSRYIPRSHRSQEDLALVSGAMGGSLVLIQLRHLKFQRFHWEPSHILCADFLQSTVVVCNASGRVRMLSLAASVPLSNEDLNVKVSELCTVGANSREKAAANIEASLSNASWVRLFKTSTPSSTEVFRMVTYCHLGAVSVWSIHASGSQLVRTFPANTPTFAMKAPIICVDDRVIFGERGYLRVVNPRTAKYERSVQLMPPSLTSPSSSECGPDRGSNGDDTTQWERGLGPLGITGGNDGRQFLCGLSNAGKSIFVVPKSALLS